MKGLTLALLFENQVVCDLFFVHLPLCRVDLDPLSLYKSGRSLPPAEAIKPQAVVAGLRTCHPSPVFRPSGSNEEL
jgi:hypothetical protein